MILNLNELAIDFRKASIEELSYEAVEKFLEEVQRCTRISTLTNS